MKQKDPGKCSCSSPHWHVPVLAFRSQSVVEAGTLKHEDLGESENTQPLLALDWAPTRQSWKHSQTSTIPETHRAHVTHSHMCTRFAWEQLLHVSCPSNNCHQPSVCPQGQSWTKISIDTGCKRRHSRGLSIRKELVFLFSFGLVALKYWKWWDCILLSKIAGSVSRSFPEAVGRDARFYRNQG